MCALQQLPAQSRQGDFASIHVHLRRNLGGAHLLQSKPANLQVAVRLNREEGRKAPRVVRIEIGIGTGIQDAVPRTFGRMRREPFGEISGRKLVSREIELKYTRWNGAMPCSRNPATPVSASDASGNLIPSPHVRRKRQGRRANLTCGV